MRVKYRMEVRLTINWKAGKMNRAIGDIFRSLGTGCCS